MRDNSTLIDRLCFQARMGKQSYICSDLLDEVMVRIEILEKELDVYLDRIIDLKIKDMQ